MVAREAGPTVEWLADAYGLPFDVIDNFNYPGHSAMRMHGLPTRSGQELIDRLRSATEASGISIVTERVADRLLTDPEGAIRGVEIVAAAGVLKGRMMTTVAKCALDVTQFGGEYVDRPCVVDGNMVSARTWHDNTALLKQFVKMLKEAARA